MSNNFSKHWLHIEFSLLEFGWDIGGNFIHAALSLPIWTEDAYQLNFNSKEGLSIVLCAMSYCLLFHCFVFEHYLSYSTTWVLAFALSIFLASLIEIELYSNLHFSSAHGCFTEGEYDFKTQRIIPHLYSSHKTISFF